MKPLYLWFLNHRLNHDEIVRQIRFMKASGAAGYFMHWLQGGEPYLGSAWLETLGVIIEQSKRENMTAWLYDEGWCPSGFAGGRILAHQPDLQAKSIWYEMQDLKAGKSYTFTYDLMRPLAIVAMPVRGGIPQQSEAIDLSDRLGITAIDPQLPFRHDWGYYPHGGPPHLHWRQVCSRRVWQFDWTPPTGDFRLYAMWERPSLAFDGVNRVNILDPQGAEAFLATTHELYATHFWQHFGSVIPGIMTDEPKHTLLAWDDGLAEDFVGAVGLPLVNALPCLVDGTIPDHPWVREAYHRQVSDRVYENFICPIATWCEEHDLQLTGHISPEEDPSHEVHYTGSIARHLTRFAIPGTDLIIQAVGNRERAGLNLGPLMASSVARQEGREQVFVEIGACCEEEMSLAELKHMADWLIVYGVNLFAWHSFNLSQDGFRKFAAGAAHHRHNNLSLQMDLLNRHVDATTDAWSSYQRCADTAVLKPMTALRATTIPGHEVPESEAMDEALVALVWGLLTAPCNIDLIDEDTATDWAVVDGRLQVGKVTYSAVMIPECMYVSRVVADTLSRMVNEGGSVICVGGLPQVIGEGAVSVWDVDVRVVPHVGAAVSTATAMVRSPVSVSGIAPGDLLCTTGRNANGGLASFCLNMTDGIQEAILTCDGREYRVILPPFGSELVEWGHLPAVTAECKEEVALSRPWTVLALQENHVPLTEPVTVIEMGEGAQVSGLILCGSEADAVVKSLRIDGISMADAGWHPCDFYDGWNVSVALGDQFGPGVHTIRFDCEACPTVLLAGDFSAFRTDHGWRIEAATGHADGLYRVANGYAYLRGGLRFSTTVTGLAQGGELVLELPGRRGHISASVNGERVGACGWAPDTIAIGGPLPEDFRLDLEVTNSSIGLLRGEADDAGCNVPILSWRVAGK